MPEGRSIERNKGGKRPFYLVLGVFFVSVVSLITLFFALIQSEGVALEDAAYSTILTALLVGPSITVASSLGRLIVVLTVISGLILIETSIATMIIVLRSAQEKSEMKKMIDEAIIRRSRQGGQTEPDTQLGEAEEEGA